MKKICAVVILYNPDRSVLDNISSYVDSADILYAIDNSEEKNSGITDALQSNPKIKYIDNRGNHGIADALNRGFQEALNAKYTHLLAMDQDSRFKPGDFKKLLASLDNDQNTGIYSPLAFENELKLFPFADLVSITSGSIFSLDAYKKVGPFNNDLFIDSVDTEYCLRMHRKGYRLKRIPSITLDHHLGNTKKARFLFWDFYATNHSSLRRYYMTRNRFYLWEKFKTEYPEFVRFDRVTALKELIKTLLVEDNKLDKIRMSIKGYFDYKKSSYGKYPSGN